MNCRGAESLAVERWPIISPYFLVVQYRLHRSLPLATVVGQMNPSHMLKIFGVCKVAKMQLVGLSHVCPARRHQTNRKFGVTSPVVPIPVAAPISFFSI